MAKKEFDRNDVNTVDAQGNTPLYVAVLRDDMDMYDAVSLLADYYAAVYPKKPEFDIDMLRLNLRRSPWPPL